MKKITLLLTTLLTFRQALTTPIPAQVYKYVDKNGVPHYTNTPNDPKYKKGKIGVSDPRKKNRTAVKNRPNTKNHRLPQNLPPYLSSANGILRLKISLHYFCFVIPKLATVNLPSNYFH